MEAGQSDEGDIAPSAIFFALVILTQSQLAKRRDHFQGSRILDERGFQGHTSKLQPRRHRKNSAALSAKRSCFQSNRLRRYRLEAVRGVSLRHALRCWLASPREHGSYVVRVKVPYGVKLMPAPAPDVISGAFYIGLGDNSDADKLARIQNPVRAPPIGGITAGGDDEYSG